jgi:hypothetical protein
MNMIKRAIIVTPQAEGFIPPILKGSQKVGRMNNVPTEITMTIIVRRK